jgi:hypothetical protein
MYWLYLDRRTILEDRQIELETQTFNLFPERWTQLYQEKTLGKIMSDQGEAEEPVTDIDMLDQWYEQMVAQGGKQVIKAGPQTDKWGDWQ